MSGPLHHDDVVIWLYTDSFEKSALLSAHVLLCTNFAANNNKDCNHPLTCLLAECKNTTCALKLDPCHALIKQEIQYRGGFEHVGICSQIWCPETAAASLCSLLHTLKCATK